MPETAEHSLIHPLVAEIMTANLAATAAASDNVIDHLERRIRHAEATLAVIRERISGLHAGPWQPSQASVVEALWPSRELIDAWISAEDGQ